MMTWSKSVVLLAGLGLGSALRGSRLKDAPKPKTAAYRQVLHNFQDMQYYADFKLGGQDIAGIFDTGSFELLVRSKRCEKCAHPTPAYDYKLSTSYIKNGSVEQHVFGSGPCISMMGYENVEVGPMNAKGQAFWEIVDHNIPVLDRAKFAAIVGIGPDFAYGNSEKTLLMSYGIQEFSICLQRASGAEGFLTWGPEKKEDFVSAPVIGNHHWVTKMVDVHFGEKGGLLTGKGGACQGTGCAAIIDSGTSLIAAPGLALMQLSEQIEPIHEDCSNLDRLPDLHFYMNGEQFTLPPQAYVMRITGALMEADNIWDILFFKPKIRKVNMCMPAFMQIDMASRNGPIWILGMPFFRFYHTTFDRTNKQMHFALAGEDCEPMAYHPNRTAALLETQIRAEQTAMDMQVDAMIPPTLSEQMDFPWNNAGEVDL